MAADLMTLTEFKQFIIDSLQLEGIRPEMIEDEGPLFGEGMGLDSVDALELVVALEKRYAIKIRSEEIDPAVFASAGTLYRHVQAHAGIGGRAGQTGHAGQSAGQSGQSG